MDFNFGIPGGGSIGKMFHSFMHPEDAYNAAGNQMRGYYGEAQGHLQPYTQQGLDQYGRLNNQANALGDPAALENQWSSGYSMSPYAQQLMDKSKEAGLDAASSMGLMGSSAALGNIQQSASDIMQSDRQKYMNDLMKKYMQSIGIGENLYGTGANAANAMSNNAMTQGQNAGQVAYAKTAAPGDMFGKLMGTGINAGINYATGGMGGM